MAEATSQWPVSTAQSEQGPCQQPLAGVSAFLYTVVMTTPVVPRLDTFTLSGAAVLDVGQPALHKLIYRPRNTLRNPSSPLTLKKAASIILKRPSNL